MSEGVGLRLRGLGEQPGTSRSQVLCVNWERLPFRAASSPLWPLSQAGTFISAQPAQPQVADLPSAFRKGQ